MMTMEHANLTVASIDATVSFMAIAFPDARIRGEGSIHGDPARGRWVHFGNDDCYVALQENRQHRARSDVPYTNDGINHVGFVVTELDDLMDRLGDAGYHVTEASVLTGHPYRRRAYFFDGNGIEWEFVEYSSERASERNDYAL